MRAVLVFCAIIAVAVACPLIIKDGCSCTKTPICKKPKICPDSWKIRIFEDQEATKLIQGDWWLQAATPMLIDGISPLYTGIFCNTFPFGAVLFNFQDTTPYVQNDFNCKFNVAEYSFNLYLDKIEVKRAILVPAYNSKAAIFLLFVQKCYTTPISKQYPLIDDNLNKYPIDRDDYVDECVVAIIGGDQDYQSYLVVALILPCKNTFKENHIILILTRDVNPTSDVYFNAYKDITSSGLSTSSLLNIDSSILKSITLPKSPFIIDDMDNVPELTSVTKSETKSIVTDCTGSSLSSTSKSITTSKTITSTVKIEINPQFTCPHELVPCHFWKGNKTPIKFIKCLDDTIIGQIFCGFYFAMLATPCKLFNTPDARFGFLNTVFPGSSLKVNFNHKLTDVWTSDKRCLMMEQNYNLLTNEVQNTRSRLSSFFPKDHPNYGSSFLVSSEGYYNKHDIEEIQRLQIEGMICNEPTDIYINQMVITILGFEVDSHVILFIPNRLKNIVFNLEDIPQIVVLTRNRAPDQETMNRILQQLLLCNVNINWLTHIDQSKILPEFVFDEKLFESEMPVSTYSFSSKSSTTISSSSSSSCSNISI